AAAARPKTERSASAKKAAATRKRNEQHAQH
ncbi:plasmid stabilization protein, partial [Agrobacterium sp. S2]|nr:plasmid stabilization protein [Agrobacterium sp. S2]